MFVTTKVTLYECICMYVYTLAQALASVNRNLKKMTGTDF